MCVCCVNYHEAPGAAKRPPMWIIHKLWKRMRRMEGKKRIYLKGNFGINFSHIRGGLSYRDETFAKVVSKNIIIIIFLFIKFEATFTFCIQTIFWWKFYTMLPSFDFSLRELLTPCRGSFKGRKGFSYCAIKYSKRIELSFLLLLICTCFIV